MIAGQTRIPDGPEQRVKRTCLWCGAEAKVDVEVEPGRKRKDKRTGVYVLARLPKTAPACRPCARRLEENKEKKA